MPGNGHPLGHTGIHTFGHMIRVCKGGGGGGGGREGEEDKVVGMQQLQIGYSSIYMLLFCC